MGIFSRSKDKSELALLFDVGSDSVGGALFYMRENKNPEIIFSFREPIALEKDFNFDKFLSGTVKTLGDVAGKICLAGLGAPQKFFCVLSSPWYASQTRTIKMEKDIPFTFTAKLADSLITKELELFKSEHLAQYENTGSKILPIELKNIKTVLNGYPSPDPLNQEATELEMTIFVSMSSEQFLNSVQRVVAQHFHREDIKFSSFVMASFAVTRDLYAAEKNFLLIDVGGEITDISLVRDDMLRSSVSFPRGLNFIVRGIANELECSTEEAWSLFSLYKDGHASGPALKKLEPVMGKLKAEWLSVFQSSLANLSKDISVPSAIFLTIDQDFSNFFSDIIKSEQFSQYTLTESKFKISFLGPGELHGGADFKGDTARDPFMIIESIYINRFLR